MAELNQASRQQSSSTQVCGINHIIVKPGMDSTANRCEASSKRFKPTKAVFEFMDMQKITGYAVQMLVQSENAVRTD